MVKKTGNKTAPATRPTRLLEESEVAAGDRSKRADQVAEKAVPAPNLVAIASTFDFDLATVEGRSRAVFLAACFSLAGKEAHPDRYDLTSRQVAASAIETAENLVSELIESTSLFPDLGE